MNSSSTRYLDKLASLRFIAAFLVVLYHFGHYLGSYSNPVAQSFDAAATYGFVGVSIFFVLSGFVISLANERWKGWRNYLAGRITRIYPPHIIVTLLFFLPIIMFYVYHGWWQIVLANLVLVHAWVPHQNYFLSFNIVTWSLSVEVAFYIAFIMLRRLTDTTIYAGATISYLLLLVCTIHLHHRWTFEVYWELYINPVARLPEFLTGMAIFRLYRKGYVPRLFLKRFNFPLILAALIAALSVTGSLGGMGGGFKEILDYTIVPLPFVGLIMCALLSEESNRYMHNRYLVLLGESSFALYLLHRPVIKLLGRPFKSYISDGGAPAALVMSAIIVLTVLVSVVFYKFIEIPLTRFLRKRITQSLASATQ